MEIKLAVFDFDGCFTDNSVIVSEDGKESVKCSRADGIGIQMLKEAWVETIIFSQEKNRVIVKRAEKLGMEYLRGLSDKYRSLLMLGGDLSDIAYFGNDLPDIDCLKAVGLPGCPSDAHPHVQAVVLARNGYITEAKGGEGAVREFCEYILGICRHEEKNLQEITTMADRIRKFKCLACGEEVEKPFGRSDD